MRKLSRAAVEVHAALGAPFAIMPLTAIASLFGMNLAHGMSEKSPALFWLVAAISGALGFVMKSWVLAAQKPRADEPRKPS